MINLSLDTKKLDLIVKEGGRFLVSKEGEKALLTFLEMKKKFEEAEEKLKAILKEKMKAEKITKVEGEKIRIIKRYYGNKYKVVDPELAKKFGFGKIKEYVSPDVEKIEEYLETMGEIPAGIKRNERNEQVVISLIKENED